MVSALAAAINSKQDVVAMEVVRALGIAAGNWPRLEGMVIEVKVTPDAGPDNWLHTVITDYPDGERVTILIRTRSGNASSPA